MSAQVIDYKKLQRQVDAHPYPLLFATISGAHLYGFPSADSDFDLRGVHLLPLEQVVGLDAGEETVEKEGVHDGLEMDLVTHDAKKFFGLMLKKNGYVLEQLLSPLVVHTTPEHEELKAIAADCVTKFHGHHYLGFAATQWKLFRKPVDQQGEPPRVKPLLYVYRVLLTGLHLMRTGQVEANLLTLNQGAKLPYIDELVERKLAGPEKGVLDAADLALHEREYARLVAELETAIAESTLPEQATGKAALKDLLVRLRKQSPMPSHEIDNPAKSRRKLYTWVVRCLNTETKEMFDRQLTLDWSLCKNDEETAEVVDVLEDYSKHNRLPDFRYLFREYRDEEERLMLFKAMGENGSGFGTASPSGYFEDQNGKQLSATDVIAIKTGHSDPIVMGDVNSILRLPRSDMSDPASWDVSASNDFVHFIQCMTILQKSAWRKSKLRLQADTPDGPYHLEGPSLDSTTSALALLRQFLLRRDDVFRHAVALYKSQVTDGRKTSWVDYELQLFEKHLQATPRLLVCEVADTTNEELIDVITYGTGLFHRKSNKDLEGRLTSMLDKYDREVLMYACDAACRTMLNGPGRVVPLFYREFAHWSNTGQCPKPTRVVTRLLFEEGAPVT